MITDMNGYYFDIIGYIDILDNVLINNSHGSLRKTARTRTLGSIP